MVQTLFGSGNKEKKPGFFDRLKQAVVSTKAQLVGRIEEIVEGREKIDPSLFDDLEATLITADLALEQNRDVLAVPGSVLSPASHGTNHLIQQGAKLVQNCQDILEELNLRAVAQQLEFKEIIPTSDTESLLLGKLSAEPSHIDEICANSGLPVSTVSSTLAMMELKGLVKSMGSMKYVLAREAREIYGVKVE